MKTERPSRIEATRRKLRIMRFVVVAGSTAAFGGFVLAARADHAGKATTSASTASTQSSAVDDDVNSSTDDSESRSFGYGSSSISPSTSTAPLVQSRGS